MKRMADVERIKGALRRAQLPKWVASTRVEAGEDAEGEPAVFVSLVVRAGKDDVLSDGDALGAARRLVQEAVDSSDVDLWPYVRFVTEAEAA